MERVYSTLYTFCTITLVSHPMSSINTTSVPLEYPTASTQHLSLYPPVTTFLLLLSWGSAIILYYCMATLSNSFIFLCFLLLPGVLAFAGPHGASYPCPCDCPSQKETQLHLFLHQFPAWDNVSNPNEVAYIGWAADHWLLTEGLYPSKNIVGRARGYHLLTGDTNKDWFISHIYAFEDQMYFFSVYI